MVQNYVAKFPTIAQIEDTKLPWAAPFACWVSAFFRPGKTPRESADSLCSELRSAGIKRAEPMQCLQLEDGVVCEMDASRQIQHGKQGEV